MTPHFFGPSTRRLFGIFHAPSQQRNTGRAVLLCNAFGHEALRVHRFYRLMAERLSRQGIAVLRFDYYGTGDSAGDDEDANMDGWAGDIVQAHRELLRLSGAQRACWFGARLGASVALRAAPIATPRVHGLVLWDAIFDGVSYLKNLRVAHVEELELSHSAPDRRWRGQLEHDPLAFRDECLGFAIPQVLREQITALRPKLSNPLPAQRVVLLASPADDSAQAWCANATSLCPAGVVRLEALKHSLVWTSNPHGNSEMVPAEALQRMIGELHGLA